MIPKPRTISNKFWPLAVYCAADLALLTDKKLTGKRLRSKMEELLGDKIDCTDKHFSGLKFRYDFLYASTSIPAHYRSTDDNKVLSVDSSTPTSLEARKIRLHDIITSYRRENGQPNSVLHHHETISNLDECITTFIGHRVVGLVTDYAGDKNIIFDCGWGLCLSDRSVYSTIAPSSIKKIVDDTIEELKSTKAELERVIKISGIVNT